MTVLLVLAGLAVLLVGIHVFVNRQRVAPATWDQSRAALVAEVALDRRRQLEDDGYDLAAIDAEIAEFIWWNETGRAER